MEIIRPKEAVTKQDARDSDWFSVVCLLIARQTLLMLDYLVILADSLSCLALLAKLQRHSIVMIW